VQIELATTTAILIKLQNGIAFNCKYHWSESIPSSSSSVEVDWTATATATQNVAGIDGDGDGDNDEEMYGNIQTVHISL